MMIKHKLFLPIVLGLSMMLVFVLVVQSADSTRVGAFISVNTNNGGTGGPDCSIRDAMTTANSGVNTGGCLLVGSGTPVTISLDVKGPYTLTAIDNSHPTFGPNGLPIVTSEIAIEGNGQTIARVNNGFMPPYFRFFLIETDGSLILRNLTIKNGFPGLTGVSGSGGGIFNTGYLSLVSTTVMSNTQSGGYGGGIMNFWWEPSIIPTLIIEDSDLSYNNGGGIYSQFGNIQIKDTTIRNNYGVGLRSDFGRINITNSTFSNNNDLFGCGGGISSYDITFSLISSTVSRNSSCDWGGGVAALNGTILIQDSTINNNFFNGINGGGGGIHGYGDSLKIINTTISGNHSETLGGGIYLGGVVTITNTTINGNDAVTEGDGIYTIDGSILTLHNSILTNHSDDDCAIYGVVNGSNNLIDTTSCGPSRLNTVTNFDPTLADNGGPTWTHALFPGSNAIDAIECDNVPETDQRGILRPQDGDGNGEFLCDIGAFELESIATSTPTSTPDPIITLTPTPSLTLTPSLTPSPTPTLTPSPQKPYQVFIPVIFYSSP